MTTLIGEPIPPEETPKERSRFLPVIPSVEPAGLPPESYIVVAPPPLPMPYGLGVTLENGGEIDNAKGRVLEAWANELNDDPVDLAGRPCPQVGNTIPGFPTTSPKAALTIANSCANAQNSPKPLRNDMRHKHNYIDDACDSRMGDRARA